MHGYTTVRARISRYGKAKLQLSKRRPKSGYLGKKSKHGLVSLIVRSQERIQISLLSLSSQYVCVYTPTLARIALLWSQSWSITSLTQLSNKPHDVGHWDEDLFLFRFPRSRVRTLGSLDPEAYARMPPIINQPPKIRE